MGGANEGRTVLQVGDVAGVAASLSRGLREHSAWHVCNVDLPQPSGDGKLQHLIDLPSRGLRARHLVRVAAKERSPDLVHVHWARFAPFIQSSKTPLVFHAHGSDVRGRAGTVSGRLVRRALARADAVLVSTPDLLADVDEGALYLPNPIDTAHFRPLDLASSNADGRPTVLLFARLIDTKGARTLLAAADQIKRARPDLRLVAFDGGTYDAEAASLGLELLPRQTRAELAALLGGVDVVIGQQHLGSLGLSELEAMSTGKPVLAFLEPGLYKSQVPVISTSGPEQVACECLRLLDDHAAASALGERAREYVVAHHDTSVVAGQLVSLYEGLL